LFRFHDEFVEALALGIWFEKNPEPARRGPPPAGHPLAGLSRDAPVLESVAVGGVSYQVRANPKPMAEILWGARYCSPTLFDFVVETAGVVYRVDLRTRRGSTRSILCNFLGTEKARREGVATLEQARAMCEPYLQDMGRRRRSLQERG